MLPPIDSSRILQMRGPRTLVDPSRPPSFVTDLEPDANGVLKQASTIFLVGKECPFRCLMCDLWQHTTETATRPGSLVQQLEQVLPKIQHRQTIKLYNASNFFDAQAVPTEDRFGLAELVRDFETVVVENHPKLLSSRVPEFAARLNGQLQVAMGLETADEGILSRLNKQMTVADYEKACEYLLAHGLSVRTFLLLPPPGVAATETVEHTLASVQHALKCGSDVTSLIPLRPGNGIMDWMKGAGMLHLPDLTQTMQTFAAALQLPRTLRQRIFLDLWNLESLTADRIEFQSVASQLHRWNMEQRPTI